MLNSDGNKIKKKKKKTSLGQGCSMPPALLAEWPGSFMCHCGNTGVEQTSNKSQHINSGEENSPAAPAGIWTWNLSITSPLLYQHAILVCTHMKSSINTHTSTPSKQHDKILFMEKLIPVSYFDCKEAILFAWTPHSLLLFSPSLILSLSMQCVWSSSAHYKWTVLLLLLLLLIITLQTCQDLLPFFAPSFVRQTEHRCVQSKMCGYLVPSRPGQRETPGPVAR